MARVEAEDVPFHRSLLIIFLLCHSREALLSALVLYFMQEYLTVNSICNIMSVRLSNVVLHLHSIITVVILMVIYILEDHTILLIFCLKLIIFGVALLNQTI